MQDKRKIIIIAGPTASGKSQIALSLASKMNGEIINGDAIQIYKDVNILSASPSLSDKALIQHHMYNYRALNQEYSVALYINHVLETLEPIYQKNRIPIIVGGTGMYLKSLCYGMHILPEIDPEIRIKARQELEKIGNQEFYQKISKLDPIGASQLHFSNSQRILRIYEIFMQTGKSINEFHNMPPRIFLENYDIKFHILNLEREILYQRCNKRFEEMWNNDLTEEVKDIYNKYGAIPNAKKIIGFTEIIDYINGITSKEEAIILAQNRTRQYAKRQITWFKYQIPNPININISNNSMNDLNKFEL